MAQIQDRAEKATDGPWLVGEEVDGVRAGRRTVIFADGALAACVLADAVLGAALGAAGAVAPWSAVVLAGARLTGVRRCGGLVASGRRGSAASSAASRAMGVCVDSIPIPVLARRGAFSILHP